MKAMVLLILFLSAQAGAATPQLPSLIQKELIKLQTDLSLTSSRQERLQLVEQGVRDLKEYRAHELIRKASDVGRLDLLISAMSSLPSPEEFKHSDCSRYENRLLEEFEPMAEEVPSDPTVLYAWDALQRLCK